ncbi:hypothetical protein NL676_002440 [Syzygium grande]|nr:hypothetical protein NL676_002440 [Syzygium grande]
MEEDTKVICAPRLLLYHHTTSRFPYLCLITTIFRLTQHPRPPPSGSNPNPKFPHPPPSSPPLLRLAAARGPPASPRASLLVPPFPLALGPRWFRRCPGRLGSRARLAVFCSAARIRGVE